MSKKYLLLLIILFGLIIICQPVFTVAEVGGNSMEIDTLNQKIEEKKDKVKQLEASIEIYKKKVAETTAIPTSAKTALFISLITFSFFAAICKLFFWV